MAFFKKHWLAVALGLFALVYFALEPGRNLLVSIFAGFAAVLSFLERLLAGGKRSGGQSGPSPEKQVDADIDVLKTGAVSSARNDQAGSDRLDKAIGATDEALRIVEGGTGSEPQ